MNKKLMGIIGLGALLGVGGVSVLLATSKGSVNKQPTTVKAPVPAPTPEIATWADQSGFTVQYPKGLIINKHDEDTENYAHLEFTAPGHPGSIIIWAKDSRWNDVDTWIKGEKRFAGATIADTTLGGQSGKKVLISGPPQERVVGAISDQILFTIDGTLIDSEYWSGIHETMSNSFVLSTNAVKAPSGESDATGGDLGGGDGPVDEEEVVE